MYTMVHDSWHAVNSSATYKTANLYRASLARHGKSKIDTSEHSIYPYAVGDAAGWSPCPVAHPQTAFTPHATGEKQQRSTNIALK